MKVTGGEARSWDVWQDPARCRDLTEALGDPANVFGGEWPGWMPEFKSVLDVGCGQGVYYPLLSSHGAFYTGMDTSEPMLELARSRFPGVAFGPGDLLDRLPCEDAAFEMVFCNAVLIHLPTLPLAELRRPAARWACYNLYVGEHTFAAPQAGGEILQVWDLARVYAKALDGRHAEVVEESPVVVGGRDCWTWRVLEEVRP